MAWFHKAAKHPTPKPPLGQLARGYENEINRARVIARGTGNPADRRRVMELEESLAQMGGAHRSRFSTGYFN